MFSLSDSVIDDLRQRISASGAGVLDGRLRDLARANKAIRSFVDNIGSSISAGATGYSPSQLILQNARNQDAQDWIKRLAKLGDVNVLSSDLKGVAGIAPKKTLGQQAASQINAAVGSLGGLGGNGGVPPASPAPQGTAAQPVATGAASGLAPIVISSRESGKSATVFGDANGHKQLVDVLKFHGLTS